MATWKGWQTQLLRSLGLPATKQNLQFLTAWQGHEGGSASFNPLNTTQGAAGATDYNSVHVRNYRSPQQGLEATTETLRNGYYPAILAALRSGNPSWSPTLGKNLSTWGTGSAWMGGYRSTPVGGASPAPQPQAGAPLGQGSPGVSQGPDIRQLLAGQLASGNPIDWLKLARQAQTSRQPVAPQAGGPTPQGVGSTPSGVPAQGGYPTMSQHGGHVPGFGFLSSAPQADVSHVDSRILSALQAYGQAIGKPITIISGYRSPTYSASVGGYSTDPHTRGVAVDAYINGVPIGNYPGAFKWLSAHGMESGAQPGFYHGKTDPEHVQIPGSGVNKKIRARTYARGK